MGLYKITPEMQALRKDLDHEIALIYLVAIAAASTLVVMYSILEITFLPSNFISAI